MSIEEYIEAAFPNLQACNWQITSEPDEMYNCIAWAIGQTRRPWWPNEFGFWPEGIPPEETIEAFVGALQTVGFVITNDGSVEIGFEKIALFAKNGTPKHASRQLHDGQWTSKLGRNHDITHETLDGVAGDLYGSVIQFLKRPCSATQVNA
jgi:hypothetical protein